MTDEKETNHSNVGLGEEWLCPWGICTTEQAKQCRAEEKGCGGRFKNMTSEQAKKEIDVPSECSKCGKLLSPNV